MSGCCMIASTAAAIDAAADDAADDDADADDAAMCILRPRRSR